METGENKIHSINNKHKDHAVHSSLAYSYFVHFIVLIIGIVLDLFFPIKIFHDSIMTFIGIMFLVFSSLLILWAQMSSTDLLQKTDVTPEYFCRGPYCYTRTPTHWGLFLAIMGFGFVINSFFVIVLTFVSFLITKFTFVKKQEDELEKKFGEAYRKYKKIVKF